MSKQHFGELAVYVATRNAGGYGLPEDQWYPIISDGRFGELFHGNGAQARELAADLLAAADAYDALEAELRSGESTPLTFVTNAWPHLDPTQGIVQAVVTECDLGVTMTVNDKPIDPHSPQGQLLINELGKMKRLRDADDESTDTQGKR